MQAAQSSTGWSIAKAQSSAFTFAAAQVGVSPGEDVHAVASLLKWYLASLPNSLLDDKLFDRWVFYSCLPLLLGMPRRCPVAANLCQLSFTRCATTTNVEMACRSLPLQQTNQPTNAGLGGARPSIAALRRAHRTPPARAHRPARAVAPRLPALRPFLAHSCSTRRAV